MCRIYAQVFKKPNTEVLKSFVDAFVESNRYDRYLARITRGVVASHDDGWGLVAVGLVDGELTVAHHKTVEPIFYESSKKTLDLYLRKISGYDELYLVIHARKASKREPYGVEYAHPYIMMSDAGVAWFAHNGGAEKRLLAEKLGVKAWMRVDSELLGFYVMDSVLSCIGGGGDVDNCVVESYMSAKHYVVKGSALNTTLIVVPNGKPNLYITHLVIDPRSPEHEEYFRIVSYTEESTSFAGSISIIDYLPEEYRNKIIKLEPGVYKLELTGIKKLADLR